MAKPKRDLMADAPYGEYGRTAMEITTPEGVVLPFIKSTFGERMGALLIDFLLIGAVMLGLFFLYLILFFMGFFKDKADTAQSIALVFYIAVGFFMRSGYFMFFEMGPRAATPGKRLMKLRVIAHDGGRLTPAAVFTRNALREVELFLPLGVVLGSMSGTGGGLIGLLAFLWALTLLLFPMFNKQGARLGDYLAGTRVVHMPKAALSYDLADLDGDRALGLTFTPEQLAYGELELGVLEQVLRDRKPAVMKAVADKIKARIGWKEPKANPPGDETFLRAYYGALRAWLESRMLLGKRRKDKTEPALT